MAFQAISFPRNTGSIIIEFLLALLCSFKAIGQDRSLDSVFISGKETMPVRLTEVGIKEIYYHLSSDSTVVYVLPKKIVYKIVYANGDIEIFNSRQNNRRRRTIGVRKMQHTRITPFQTELYTISDEQLVAQKRKHKISAAVLLPGGITAAYIGMSATLAGFFSLILGQSELGNNLVTFGTIGGAGLSVPLIWNGAIHIKKLKYIKMEMRRRGLSDK